MNKKSSWVDFFNDHAPDYDDNCFTKNTEHEIGFLLEELDLSPGASLLDVGCGTGRHAVELAKLGYAVTGVDLSEGMLNQAQAKAEAAGVSVDWVQSDATKFSLDKAFDAAICLCEGSFGLLGSGDDAIEHPLAILRNISNSLKPGANVLLTVLSAFRLARRHTQEDVEQGIFDPLTLTEMSEISLPAPADGQPDMRLWERGFVPTELILLFRQAGMEIIHIWGGTAGDWNRGKINLDEYEIMVVARKV